MSKINMESEISSDSDMESVEYLNEPISGAGMVDDDYEVVRDWTMQEIDKYVNQRMETLVRDPAHNPLLAVRKRSAEVRTQIENLYQAYLKIVNDYGNLTKDQSQFLQSVGALTPTNVRSIGVGVDFPILPIDKTNEEKKEGPSTVPKKSGGSVECIDLTSDDELPASAKEKSSAPTVPVGSSILKNVTNHPVALPSVYQNQASREVPSKPILSVSNGTNGIILKIDLLARDEAKHIKTYEIFCYQEKGNLPPGSSPWQKICGVNALALPMTCTLTKFMKGCKYHFVVRAVSKGDVFGHFSNPCTIVYS